MEETLSERFDELTLPGRPAGIGYSNPTIVDFVKFHRSAILSALRASERATGEALRLSEEALGMAQVLAAGYDLSSTFLKRAGDKINTALAAIRKAKGE